MTATRHRRPLALAGAAALGVLALGGLLHGQAAGSVGFSTTYVDPASGGGEGYVIYSHAAHQYVYSSHEGTTLTRSSNAPGGTNCDINPSGTPSGYLCSYDNQVNIWYSSDGKTWTKSTGNPLYTGFSDPSLTEDECTVSGQCNVYDTGIDLANDAVYASPDGGRTWVAGTPQCHDGDRPWLAGGRNGEVFLASNTEEGGHKIFQGTITQAAGQNAVLQCSTTGIADAGGHGQIYYNHHDGNLIEPKTGGGKVGIGVLPDASAFNTTFQSRLGPAGGDGIEHWPSIAISTDATPDAPSGVIYAVWDTAPRAAGSNHGCGSDTTGPGLGGSTLLQNAVMLSYTTDEGTTWSTPTTVASSGGTVMWPWVTAGANGNVAVAWYQANQVTDPDCDSANLLCTQAGSPCPTQWSIDVANIYGVAGAGTADIQPVNAVTNFDGKHAFGAIHVGNVCEGGTTCAATGQDRRLGDFFTTSLDAAGCLMIASGDTAQVAATTGQQMPNSLPLFIHQNSGPSLTTGQDCAGPSVSAPESRLTIGLVAAGAAAAYAATRLRRRRAGQEVAA